MTEEGDLLPHGYTNRTVRRGDGVQKTYVGPDAAERMSRERAALTRLGDRLPVPAVEEVGARTLVLTRMPGTHGQDLLASGYAADVLAACGRVLTRVHALDATGWFADGAGGRLVHGDFGPNNTMFHPGTFEVTAVLDWEWAHTGDPVTDLAWCEWIVRMHHREDVDQLGEFFAAYGGAVPSWTVRQAMLVARCEELRAMCHRADPGGRGEQLWTHRTEVTAAWTE